MRSRAIYISGPARITELQNRFNVTISPFYSGRFLFELSSLDAEQEKILLDIDRLSPVLRIWETSTKGTILAAVHEAVAASYIERIPDTEIRDFFSRVHHFYSASVKPDWGRLNLVDGPLIMGILNVTPDSFSDGGKFLSVDKALEHALQMEADGAQIIDVGGESTRPGARLVSADEELDRVAPVVKAIREKSDVLISVDTRKSIVAKAALDNGADIINDISGLRFDPDMEAVAAEYDCPVVVMHMKGEPGTMQNNPWYDDVMQEIYLFFEDRIDALQNKGIRKIILDPGIGFGKRIEDNLTILRNLKDFRFLNRPILVGASRKSFIGKILNKNVDDRLYGSLTSHLIALEGGAQIIRVHEVGAAKDTIGIYTSTRPF